MAQVKLTKNGETKTYIIPDRVICPKDSMIATFSTRINAYECCDCPWTMSAKEYIEKNSIEPEMEEEYGAQ